MPSSREAVVNRVLSGSELKAIILAHFARLVDNEGLLSPHIAFGRVSYSLRLVIDVDNPNVPQSVIEDHSRRNVDQPVVESEVPLVNRSPEAELGALELTHKITSPNAERLAAGMPVPVIVKQQDGTLITEHIKYPPDAVLEGSAGEVMLKDATEQVKAQFGLLEPSQTEPPPQ